jgi:ATP-dependent Clp protease protease subunit
MANIIRESVKGLELIPIEDMLLNKNRIFLTEEVNSETTNELLKKLMYLEHSETTDEITLFINSPGGDVSSGLAVYDYINIMTKPVNTVCTGTAASMGAILFLAGKKRSMLPNTRVMIHDPSFSGGNLAGKKPHEIQHDLDKLNESRKKLAGIIAEKTGKSIDEIYEITKEDSFYNADEAIDFGLATEIYKETI